MINYSQSTEKKTIFLQHFFEKSHLEVATLIIFIFKKEDPMRYFILFFTDNKKWYFEMEKVETDEMQIFLMRNDF